MTGSGTPERDWWRVVKPTGWTVLGLGLLAGLVAATTHWRELVVLSVACLVLMLLALPFLLGRTRVAVRLVVEPQRVLAGESVSAGVRLVNLGAGRLLPTVLDLPVGAALHRYHVPMLSPGSEHEETLTIRTEHRGVIQVGPATTRRGDPLGLMSRDVSWTEVVEVLVRPPMVALDSMGAGLLRDLEGIAIDAISESDLAFHALREYVPGDELRHVHWRSSAKAMAAAGETQLLVRQYLDTRRSHVTVVVDDRPEVWSDPGDFETAMSVAASLAARALLDELTVSFLCGAPGSSGDSGLLALDAVCRAGFGKAGLVDTAQRAAVLEPGTSLAFVVTGASAGFDELLRAAVAFGPGVRRIGLVVEPGRPSRATEVDGIPVLHLADAEDLAGLLRWSVR